MRKIIFSVSAALLSFVMVGAQTIQDARKLTNSEQYEKASSIYRDLIAASPNEGNLYYYYAENFMLSDAPDSARLFFDKGKLVDPNNPLIEIGKAKVLMLRISVNESKAAVEMNPNNKESQDLYETAKANVKEAGALLDKVTSTTKDVNILVEAAEACLHFTNKDLDRAKTILDKAESIDKSNIDVKLLYGDMYAELNNGTLAADYYNRALDLDKTSARAIVSKGKLYKRSTNYDGAAREFKDAISIEPSYAPAYRELGETYIKQGKLSEAKEEYKKYLELSKNNCRARTRYAAFLHASKNYKEALAELMTAKLNCDSNNLNLVRMLAYNYYENREDKANIEKGLYNIKKLFSLIRPEWITAKDHEYYGKLEIVSGNDSLGIEHLEKALSLDPTRTDLLSDMANARINLKQYPKAAELLNQKLALGKDVKAQDHLSLVKAYYFNKQFAEADVAAKKTTELYPTWGSAWLYRAKVNANIDSTSEAGLAKPFYEKYIEIAEADSAKKALYQNGLIESYGYLAYYYILKKDNINALLNLIKKNSVLPPDSEEKKKVQQAIDQLEGKGGNQKK